MSMMINDAYDFVHMNFAHWRKDKIYVHNRMLFIQQGWNSVTMKGNVDFYVKLNKTTTERQVKHNPIHM